jgi:hypothetical protein
LLFLHFGNLGGFVFFTTDKHEVFLLFNNGVFGLTVAALNFIFTPCLPVMYICVVGTAKSDCNASLPTNAGNFAYFISLCSHELNLLKQWFLASLKKQIKLAV